MKFFVLKLHDNVRLHNILHFCYDHLLTSNAVALGSLNTWTSIAAKLPSRTNKDCRKRWSKICTNVNRGAWTEEEDSKLLAAVDKHGCQWTQVAMVVGTRHADRQYLPPGLIFIEVEFESLNFTSNSPDRVLKTMATLFGPKFRPQQVEARGIRTTAAGGCQTWSQLESHSREGVPRKVKLRSEE